MHDERLLTMTFLALVLAIVIIITLDEPERAGFWVRRFREGMRCASRAEVEKRRQLRGAEKESSSTWLWVILGSTLALTALFLTVYWGV